MRWVGFPGWRAPRATAGPLIQLEDGNFNVCRNVGKSSFIYGTQPRKPMQRIIFCNVGTSALVSCAYVFSKLYTLGTVFPVFQGNDTET
jgi:hypothetical protein